MRLKAIYDLSSEPYSNEMIRANECYLELLCADIYDKPRVAGVIEVGSASLIIAEGSSIEEVADLLNVRCGSCTYDPRNNKIILRSTKGNVTISENLAKDLGLPTQIENKTTVTGEFAPRGIRYIVLKSEDIAMTDTQAPGLDTKTLCIFTPGNNFSYVNYNVADQIPIVSNKTMRFLLVDNFGNEVTDRKCCIEFILDTVRRHEKTSGYFRIGQRYRMPKDITRVALAEVVPLARLRLVTEDMLRFYCVKYSEYDAPVYATYKSGPNKGEIKLDKDGNQIVAYYEPMIKITQSKLINLAEYDNVLQHLGKPISKQLIKDMLDALSYALLQTAVAGYNEANNKYCIVMKNNVKEQQVKWEDEWRRLAAAIDLPAEEIEAKANGVAFFTNPQQSPEQNNWMLYFPPQFILSILTISEDNTNYLDGIVVGACKPLYTSRDNYRVPTFVAYLEADQKQYIRAWQYNANKLSVTGELRDIAGYDDHLDLYVNDRQLCRLNYEDGLLRQKNVAYFEMIEVYPSAMLETSLQTQTRQPKDAPDCFIKLFLR